MSKRGLNIYHRKDGRYEGRYTYSFATHGRSKYRSVYGRSYTEVREKLLEIRAKTAVPKAVCKLTVGELFSEWLSAKRTQVKISTYYNYAFKAEKHLIPAFGKLKINKLTPDMIYKFIREKQVSGLSNKYIADIVVVLKNMAKYAAKTHNCVNPVSDVELPKAVRYEPEIYKNSEQKRLETALMKDMDGVKMAVLLALYTGVRIGELCGLKWSDIDFTAKNLHIKRTVQRIRNLRKDGILRKIELIISSPKSRTSERTIPLPDFLINILKKFKLSDENVFILTDSSKIPDPRTLQYRFKAILRKNQLRDTNFHSLRHLFATNCIEAGFDVKTLSEILGHSSVEITLNRYVHSSFERKRACMNMLKPGVT